MITFCEIPEGALFVALGWDERTVVSSFSEGAQSNSLFFKDGKKTALSVRVQGETVYLEEDTVWYFRSDHKVVPVFILMNHPKGWFRKIKNPA